MLTKGTPSWHAAGRRWPSHLTPAVCSQPSSRSQTRGTHTAAASLRGTRREAQAAGVSALGRFGVREGARPCGAALRQPCNKPPAAPLQHKLMLRGSYPRRGRSRTFSAMRYHHIVRRPRQRPSLTRRWRCPWCWARIPGGAIMQCGARPPCRTARGSLCGWPSLQRARMRMQPGQQVRPRRGQSVMRRIKE